MLPQRLHIIIADDCDSYRNGIALDIACDTIEVVAQVANGLEVLEKLKQIKVDVVLLDIRMPLMGGIETCRHVKAQYSGIGVIGLSMYDPYHPDVQEMLKAGADAFLTKNDSHEKFLRCIHSVANGDRYYSGGCGPVVDNLFAGNSLLPQLNERELQLLQHICDDLSSVAIGAIMHLSPFTVDKQREALMKKCGVKNKLKLVKFALKNKLVKW